MCLLSHQRCPPQCSWCSDCCTCAAQLRLCPAFHLLRLLLDLTLLRLLPACTLLRLRPARMLLQPSCISPSELKP